jgi:uncharacterized membrane protein YphA (DoxX/SURF4 family)
MKDLSGEGYNPSARSVHYALRIASAMCFLGHGIFGIITKPIWCNYFAVAGIGHDLAYRLMPLVGVVDIVLGLSLLFYPIRAVAAWLVGWGLLTAALRPLSGEPFAEMIERAGNYCAPLALLLLSGSTGTQGRGWLWSALDPRPQVNARTLRTVTFCLRIAVFLLLLGHGWLNLIEKKGLLAQYAGLGFSQPTQTAHLVGMFELLAALAVLVRPVRPLLFGLLVWKMATELFYPHWELFEWIERGGSYGCILALWLALGQTPVRIRISKTRLAF